jgi:hypothetical protein
MTKLLENKPHWIKLVKFPILVSLFTCVTTAIAPAEEAGVSAAPTQEQLVLKRRQAIQHEADRKLVPPKGPDPSTVNPPKNLVSDSDTLCFNGNVTLVPKGAVLQLPKNLADRLKYQPGAKLMSWADFYAINRAWITTQEVSLGQAEGTLPFTEESQKQMLKTGNLVVATYRRGPISVLPPKVSVEAAAKTPSNVKTPITPKS